MANNYMYLAREKLKEYDTVFVPIGSVEGHSFLPVGTDTFIAEAFAVSFADETKSLYLPAIWTGVTPNTMRLGAVSVKNTVLIELIVDICRTLRGAGMKKIILVSIHNGNDATIKVAIEKLYFDDSAVVYYINPYRFIEEECKLSFKDNAQKETALYHASCNILGGKLPEEPTSETNTPKNEHLQCLRKYGYIAYEYETELQHMDIRVQPPMDKAHEYFALACKKVRLLVKEMESLMSKEGG